MAQETLKVRDLEIRGLETNLENLSHKSDGHNSLAAKLSKEKSTLEARVRELEANLRLLSCPPVTPGKLRTPARGRASSLSDPRISSLENDLTRLRTALAHNEAELKAKEQKLIHAQNEVMKIANEKVALEKRLGGRVQELEVSMEEKDEELEYLRSTQGDSGREEKLLQRIEEDEAKISALEMLLGGDIQDVKALKGKLQWTEQRLELETKHAAEEESRNAELAGEKEDALDALENAQAKIAALSQAINDKEAYLKTLEQ